MDVGKADHARCPARPGRRRELRRIDYAAGLAARQADAVRVTATAELVTAGGIFCCFLATHLGLAAASAVLIATAGGS